MGTMLRTGKAFLSAGNIDAAEKIAEEALDRNPENEDALTLRCECLLNREDYSKAIALVEFWVGQEPHSVRASGYLIRAYFEANKLEAACKAIKHHRDAFPHDGRRIAYFEALYKARKGKSLRVDSDLGNLPVDTGLELKIISAFRLRHYVNALRLCREVSETQPDNSSIHRIRALAAFRSLRFKEARQAAREAIQLSPDIDGMRETILASYIAYFPPFFITHAIFFFAFWMREKAGTIGYLIGVLVFAVFVVEFGRGSASRALSPYGLNEIVFWSGVAWFVYVGGIFGRNWPARLIPKKSIELKDY